MPFPAGAAAWKWAKVAVKAAEAAVPIGYAYLDSLLTDSGEASDVQFLRWVTKVTRSAPAGVSEDASQFKLDLVNLTGGSPDYTYTGADFAAIKARMDTLCTALKPETANVASFSEYRAYRMIFDPAADEPSPDPRIPYRPFLNSGPPLYIAAGPGAGTGAGSLPYQVAATVTFRTAWPKHWGRAYMTTPWHTAGFTDANARIVAGYRTAVANAWHTAIAGLADDGFMACVPVTQIGKQKAYGLLGITDVVVDDVPDVIRRRRARSVAARTVGV